MDSNEHSEIFRAHGYVRTKWLKELQGKEVTINDLNRFFKLGLAEDIVYDAATMASYHTVVDIRSFLCLKLDNRGFSVYSRFIFIKESNSHGVQESSTDDPVQENRVETYDEAVWRDSTTLRNSMRKYTESDTAFNEPSYEDYDPPNAFAIKLKLLKKESEGNKEYETVPMYLVPVACAEEAIAYFSRYCLGPPNCPTVLATVVGGYDKGKSFLINKLSGLVLPEGDETHTRGLSFAVAKPNGFDKRVVYLDSQGSDAPSPVHSMRTFKEPAYEDIPIAEDKKLADEAIRTAAYRAADVLIHMVSYLTVDDQANIQEVIEAIEERGRE